MVAANLGLKDLAALNGTCRAARHLQPRQLHIGPIRSVAQLVFTCRHWSGAEELRLLLDKDLFCTAADQNAAATFRAISITPPADFPNHLRRLQLLEYDWRWSDYDQQWLKSDGPAGSAAVSLNILRERLLRAAPGLQAIELHAHSLISLPPLSAVQELMLELRAEWSLGALAGLTQMTSLQCLYVLCKYLGIHDDLQFVGPMDLRSLPLKHACFLNFAVDDLAVPDGCDLRLHGPFGSWMRFRTDIRASLHSLTAYTDNTYDAFYRANFALAREVFGDMLFDKLVYVDVCAHDFGTFEDPLLICLPQMRVLHIEADSDIHVILHLGVHHQVAAAESVVG